MSRSPLSRIAGPVAIVAGVSVVLTRLVIMATIPPDLAGVQAAVVAPAHAINGPASILAFALLVIAIVAIYEWEAQAAGWLGVIGLGAAVIGTIFMAGDWWYEAFAVPWLAVAAPVVFETGAGGRLLVGGLASFALFSFGWVIFGAATVRAGVFPARISLSILAGGVLSGIPIAGAYLYGSVIFGLALCWLGVWMLRSTAAPRTVAEPAPI